MAWMKDFASEEQEHYQLMAYIKLYKCPHVIVGKFNVKSHPMFKFLIEFNLAYGNTE